MSQSKFVPNLNSKHKRKEFIRALKKKKIQVLFAIGVLPTKKS